jgi:hypothetical protein
MAFSLHFLLCVARVVGDLLTIVAIFRDGNVGQAWERIGVSATAAIAVQETQLSEM